MRNKQYDAPHAGDLVCQIEQQYQFASLEAMLDASAIPPDTPMGDVLFMASAAINCLPGILDDAKTVRNHARLIRNVSQHCGDMAANL